MLEGASQQKGSLDSEEQGSKHSTEIQGWGHYSEKTTQTPHFDPQAPQSEAHLTWCRPLFNLYGLPAEGFLPPSEYVKLCLSLRPQYRLLLPGRPALQMAASLSPFT